MSNELKRVGLAFDEEGSVKFVKTLKEVNSAISDNNLEFKKAQAQWDKTTPATEKLKFQIDNLGKAIELQKEKSTALREEINKLENAEESNTKTNKKNQEQLQKKRKELEKTELKIISYTKKLEDMKNQLENTGKKWEENGLKIEKFGNKIEKAGKKLSAFSVATASAFVASAKVAIDFESAFTGVEKTVDGTAEQMEELKQGIRNMAKEIPSTTTEISAVAEAAGQLGIKTEDILSFTRVMIDLGNSTNLSADEAASSLAKFANVTKMSAKDYDKLGSTIVALGNNFATTEADIVAMSTRLAATGELAGLSQSQILSLATAMSSVGIEAEAGGSAMSKLLKQIQVATETGGKELNSFAKVAGMSGKDFKKAFEKDALSALTAFISGLNDTERNGKSAISVLNDMGIKEVRLSNTILSLANASDVMTKAVKLGSEAWEDNTALTNEANKRYETLESKIKKAINKLKDMAITVGNKLMPHVEKVIDIFGKWIKNFEKLSDKEVKMIITLGLIVAAIGPVVTIFGKLTSVVGVATKGIGTVIQAIGVMKGTTVSSSVAVNGLATTMKALVSPVGIATTTLALFAAGVAIVKSKVDEELKSTKELTQEINNSISARQGNIDAINEQQNANLSEINNVQALKNELSTLVGENGKVKEGYESRTKFILNELNKALGTEYSLNENVIESYQDMSQSIDDLIIKKKAQIILEANEEKYKDAIKNKTKAYEDYIKTQKEINELLPKYNQLLEDQKRGWIGSEYSMIQGSLTLKEYSEQLVKLKDTLESQDTQLQEYSQSISEYNTNTQLMLEGGAENLRKIEQSVAISQSNITKNANEELTKRIENQILANEETRELYALEVKYNEDAKNSVYATNVKEGQKQLELLTDQLIERTSTTEKLSENEIEAWENLANNSYNTYSKKISLLPPELKNKIEEMTGVIAEKTPEVVNETSNMSQQVLDQIEKNQQFREEAINNLLGMLNGLEDGQLRQLLQEAGAQDVERVMEGIRKGDLAETEGVSILKGLYNGLNNSSWQSSLWNIAKGIASKLSGLLSVKANVDGNTSAIPGHKLGLDYVPKDNYLARLHKGERVLTKEENEEYTNAEESDKKNKTAIMNLDYNKFAETIALATNNTNQKIIDLLTKILEKSGKSIVLDTGQLVGATSDAYDVALADNQTRRKRGN